MLEANHALENATEHSLILLDEIGRGTSTYDGMALAQAIIEYIHDEIKAKTLFSTHYHELTDLETNLPALKNLQDRKSTRLNSSHVAISYAVFWLQKKRRERLMGRI